MAEVDLNELERYLRIFQENPDSRVFAPLADLYRRLGRLAEAEEICREGIERHPYYAGGRVALAHILLDCGRLDGALAEAEAVVTYYPDNLLARKILIRVLGGMGKTDRAKREFEALRHLAPQVASDPEIERALQGPSQARSLAASPGQGETRVKNTFKPLERLEKTEFDPSSGLEQSQAELRLQKLLRKKLILETWLGTLGKLAQFKIKKPSRMIETNEFKKNAKIQIDNMPFVIVDFQHVKPGKGQAFTRCKLKNLKTGQMLERTFKSGERFEEPNLEIKTMQFLYLDGDMINFMDTANYEQLSLNKNMIGDQAKFLSENMEVTVLFYDDKPITVELPNFVVLPITYCEPGFKGDTATGASKPATLAGGHVVNVPLHLKEGDMLKIDTRSGDYVEKINK